MKSEELGVRDEDTWRGAGECVKAVLAAWGELQEISQYGVEASRRRRIRRRGAISGLLGGAEKISVRPPCAPALPPAKLPKDLTPQAASLPLPPNGGCLLREGEGEHEE